MIWKFHNETAKLELRGSADILCPFWLDLSDHDILYSKDKEKSSKGDKVGFLSTLRLEWKKSLGLYVDCQYIEIL